MSAPNRLLLINPNTTEDVTALMKRHLQPLLPAGSTLRACTAPFGAPYIACEASHAVAAHAVLAAWSGAWGEHNEHAQQSEAASPAFDAVLIGCFGDPGLFALRECCPVPVTGLAEASFIEAARHGPFAIVTGGARWKVMLERLAQSLGYAADLVHVETVVPTGAQLRADPAMARTALGQACEAAQGRGARSVIVGGAGLAGWAAELQPYCAVPLIDSVQAGGRVLLQGLAPKRSMGAGEALERLELVRACTGQVQ